MFGFLIGTVSLIGLVKVLRHGCGYGHGRWGGGYGRWGGGYGPRGMLRWLFRRLDTTVGQEKVILEAFEQTREQANKVHEELFAAKDEVARALRSEAFDSEAVNQAFARQEAAFQALRESLRISLSKIHEALDARQRGVLADMLERAGRHGYGYGRGCHGHARRGCHGGPGYVNA